MHVQTSVFISYKRQDAGSCHSNQRDVAMPLEGLVFARVLLPTTSSAPAITSFLPVAGMWVLRERERETEIVCVCMCSCRQPDFLRQQDHSCLCQLCVLCSRDKDREREGGRERVCVCACACMLLQTTLSAPAIRSFAYLMCVLCD